MCLPQLPQGVQSPPVGPGPACPAQAPLLEYHPSQSLQMSTPSSPRRTRDSPEARLMLYVGDPSAAFQLSRVRAVEDELGTQSSTAEARPPRVGLLGKCPEALHPNFPDDVG